jgi:hypothetical protein
MLGAWVKSMVLDPYDKCLEYEHFSEQRDREGNRSHTNFDCGANAIEHLWMSVTSPSGTLSQKAIFTAFVATLFYVSFAAPCIIYRIILYVAKGRDWRDVA